MELGVDWSADGPNRCPCSTRCWRPCRVHATSRELFQQLTAVLGPIVPHDEARLVLRNADGSAYLYFRTPDNASEGIADEVAAAMLETTEPQLLDAIPGPDRGLQRGLAVPVKVDDRIVGVLALFSRNPQGFSASG